MRRKVGRNDLCFCGSGRNKRCHGAAAARSPLSHADSPATPEGDPATVGRANSTRLERYLTRQYLLDHRFRFWYLVPHPDQDPRTASPLQLYTPGILKTAAVFAQLASWPADIREWSAEPRDVLIHRILGHLDKRLLPVEFSAFEQIVSDRARPFLCVVSTEESHEFVTRCIAPYRRTWLHVSTEKIPDALFIEDATPAVLRDYAVQAVQEFAKDSPYPRFTELVGPTLSESVFDARIKLEGIERRNGVTIPNEVALRAFGFDLTKLEYLVPNDPSAYVQASIQSAVLVEKSRDALIGTRRLVPNNRFIVTVLSPAWSFRKTEIERHDLPVGSWSSEIASVWRSMLRQEVHYHTGKSADIAALAKDEFVQSMFTMRRQEAAAYTASLSVHASHDMTPVLRLEPRVNRIRDKLSDIGSCARGNGPHRSFKLRKLVARMSDELVAYVDARYVELLSQSRDRIEGLSLVTDLPLEFMSLNGMPLGILFDSSRIPVNPGNLSFGQLLHHRMVELTQSAFGQVLIVRSFSKTDPVRNVLEHSIAAFSRNPGDLPDVRIVDVHSPQDFIRAVNDYAGAILIFDGHGSHNSTDQTSPIVVGGKPMDVWLYRNELSLPPIVVLSSCDTVPLDGSHGSSAVGFLNAGAVTVLGTVLPIAALTAGSFIARLLFRIAQFLPQAASHSDRPLEWRGFLAGLLRMTHVTELAQEAAIRFSLPENTFRDIQMVANTHINHRDPLWHEAVIEQMRRSLPPAWHSANPGPHPLNQLTDSMKYVQLGHPERIRIVSDQPELSERSGSSPS